MGDGGRLNGPRAATFTVFFVHGAVVGTWIGHIPWVSDRFDFSKSTLGLVLLAMSVGVIAALPVMGQAIVSLGSVRSTRITGIACAAALPLPLLAPEPWLLPPALVALGTAAGSLDVSMNAHGVAVERARGRPVMSSLHAGWSLGGVASAVTVWGLGAAGVDPRLEGILAAAALLFLLAASLPRLGEGSATAKPAGLVRPGRGVVLLAGLCFLIMVTEGAMGDWGGLYLARDLGTSTALAALAFAAFSAGMLGGRLLGDWLHGRVGAAALMRWGTALAGVALGTMMLAGSVPLAFAGFVLVGVGVANGVPLIFSAAGHSPGLSSGPNIAVVNAMGSIGFLAGPPFIGFLAEATSLPVALASLCLGLGAVVLASKKVGAGQAGALVAERAAVG